MTFLMLSVRFTLLCCQQQPLVTVQSHRPPETNIGIGKLLSDTTIASISKKVNVS